MSSVAESIPDADPEPRFIRNVTTRVITSLSEAERMKEMGNASFKQGNYRSAADHYQMALSVAPPNSPTRAVYYGNLAACNMHLSNFEAAVEACHQALGINGRYVKVLMRRSAAYEELKEYEKALNDAKQVLEIEPGHETAMKVLKRLEEKTKEENEAVKEEMIGKLKDLGNTVLGKFGVSLDDFKAEKDPGTGSYSVSFKK